MYFLVNLPILAETTPIQDLLADASTILSSVVTMATSITTWVLNDPFARIFLAIMLLMLALHFVKSFIRTA